MPPKFRFIFISTLLVILASQVFAKVNPDSLQRCADNATLSDSLRVDAMVSLSLYYKDNDMGRSLNLSQNALSLAEESGSAFLLAKAQDNHATVLKFKGEYKRAEELYLLAAETFEELHDTLYLSLTYSHLGSYYQAVDQNQLAILYMLRSLKMDQGREGAEQTIAATLNNIGNVYYTDKNYEKALEFYKGALLINVPNKFQKWEAINYLNIGNTYKDMKQIDSAAFYYQRSIDLSEKLNIIWVVAAAHEGLGSCKLEQDKPQEARVEFQKGLVAAKQFGNKELELYLQCGLARALKGLGKIDSAKIQWQTCMDTALYYKFSMITSQLYLAGAEIFETSGDFRKANQLYKSYCHMSDSVELAQNAIMYRNFEERLKQEDEEHQKELFRQSQQEKNEAEFRRNRIILWFVVVVLLLAVAFGLFAFRSYRLKKKSHERLELQKDIIEEKNNEILSSISYAQRLQSAIMPSDKTWKSQFPESFILYRPKDIVAGDFFWMEEAGDHLMFAAADCTGHGVPGALVSVVCSNALKRSVHEFGLTATGPVLDKVAGLVTETFENSGSDVYDGMDISLCSYNRKTGTLLWTGANLPIWICRAGTASAEEIKPDKQPIGKFDLRKPFTTHEVSVSRGDMIFLLTDGYADQFGGPKGKKFKYKPLQELLCRNAAEPMEVQRERLIITFDAWRGNLEQVDDVCVIGIRI